MHSSHAIASIWFLGAPSILKLLSDQEYPRQLLMTERTLWAISVLFINSGTVMILQITHLGGWMALWPNHWMSQSGQKWESWQISWHLCFRVRWWVVLPFREAGWADRSPVSAPYNYIILWLRQDCTWSGDAQLKMLHHNIPAGYTYWADRLLCLALLDLLLL